MNEQKSESERKAGGVPVSSDPTTEIPFKPGQTVTKGPPTVFGPGLFTTLEPPAEAGQALLPREERIAQGGATQAHYEYILDECANLRLRKVAAYGERRYQEQDMLKRMSLSYADLYRKWIRIEHLILTGQYEGTGDESLETTLKDMANYSVMAIQMIRQAEQRKIEAAFRIPNPFGVPELSGGVLGMQDQLNELAGEGAARQQTHQEIYDEGHQDGFEAGSDSGFSNGYDQGYKAALEHKNAPNIGKANPVRTPCIDQIAVTTKNPERTKLLLTLIFGLRKWTEDVATAEGEVYGKPSDNEAKLSFNYELVKDGLEFEVLEYRSGRNWLERKGKATPVDPRHAGRSAVSHFGVHVDNLDLMADVLKTYGFQVAQAVTTTKHTNPNIPANRRYRYVIFDTEDELGFDLKLIQRVTLEEENAEDTAKAADPAEQYLAETRRREAEAADFTLGAELRRQAEARAIGVAVQPSGVHRHNSGLPREDSLICGIAVEFPSGFNPTQADLDRVKQAANKVAQDVAFHFKRAVGIDAATLNEPLDAARRVANALVSEPTPDAAQRRTLSGR